MIFTVLPPNHWIVLEVRIAIHSLRHSSLGVATLEGLFSNKLALLIYRCVSNELTGLLVPVTGREHAADQLLVVTMQRIPKGHVSLALHVDHLLLQVVHVGCFLDSVPDPLVAVPGCPKE